MPLYIKLDIGSSGLVHAWTSRNECNFVGDSVASGKSSAQALRKLARSIPIPKPTAKPEVKNG